VLVAEDDESLGEVLARGLREQGYVVDLVPDGETAAAYLRFYQYEVAVLDWRMPRLSGLDLVHRLRRGGTPTPVLMLTAKDTPADRIVGLDAGADDYLVKPFDFGELLARLRALQRRPPVSQSPRMVIGELVFDPAAREPRRDGPIPADDGAGGRRKLIAGQSLAGDAHTERLLLYGEVIAGPFLLLAMFGGSLVVGLRALAPVEQSRRRQLEFTADASHELRTPLSVIRAEADVALSSPREAAEYRDALTRIQGESQRLRQLVDDMLWLARFDSRPPPTSDEPVDLVTLAQACADRFRAVGPAITTDTGTGPALISAPPEWIDRLAGVLMDNACRYAGADGQVKIQVRAHGSRISLTVEDSGPGIPEAERPRLFDRFHRANEHGSGAGLGLAVGDSIVRSTGGRWQIGDSPLGGALMAVSWRHSQPHRPAASRLTASSVSGGAP
jgi:signal transduction histidine kinase